MNHIIIFYELIHVLFCFNTGDAGKYNKENFVCKKNSKYTIQVCKNSDFENLFPVLFCQLSDDICELRSNRC